MESEMSDNWYKTDVLEKWCDIRRKKYTKPDWIYRGQRQADWPLKTSLQRCLKRREVPPSRALEVEEELLREFRRAHHLHSQHMPSQEDIVEWLSLMQHHGAPTRLLDFTYSIYVAAYFAIEAADDDAAIWAVDSLWALDESMRLLKAVRTSESDVQQLSDRFVEGSEHIVRSLFFEPPLVPLACPINPFRLNERLRIQKGVFLMAGSVEVSFKKNLKALAQAGSRERILKIVIPRSCFKEAFKDLHRMNISRASLFPGLDGYAQALGVFHPCFDRKGMLWCRG